MPVQIPLQRLVIIYGPTGVGKTALADTLSQNLPIEIINMDMGQFYTPLSIGTAKPNLKATCVPHHLFDVIDQPVDAEVVWYANQVNKVVHTIEQRGSIAVLVGGSGFYLKSLFFPPCAPQVQGSFKGSWGDLNAIDPMRAAAINQHDTYRIERALAIWHTTGKKPSSFQPYFVPLARHIDLIMINRPRVDLYNQIHQRTDRMIQEGWLDEIRSLQNTPWQDFIMRKGLIGYAQLFDYCENKYDLKTATDLIKQETCRYAKRQITFWRSLQRSLAKLPSDALYTIRMHEIDLTIIPPDLYIERLLTVIKND